MTPILTGRIEWLEMSRMRIMKVWQELVEIPVDKILEGHSLCSDIFIKLNVQPHIPTQKLTHSAKLNDTTTFDNVLKWTFILNILLVAQKLNFQVNNLIGK